MTQLLLDTHALLWWLAEPDRLSPAAHAGINFEELVSWIVEDASCPR